MNLKILRVAALRGLRLIVLLSLIFGLMLGIDVGSSIAAQQPQVVQPPVTGLVSTLSDEVKESTTDLISWSTYWQLCWDAYPGAKEYELQKVLVEGKSPKLQRQSDRCFRLQAASNENKKSQGLLNRDLILLVHKTQLAYRVRAVLDDNRVSEWSPPMAVGATTESELNGTPISVNP
ncbi:hypothetical protein [Anabaena azotica]|uniref:Uncharacterized protein n=1 Tax=Anabaena azotica FACHB-119 TaxID=947527 RepID=A0ABR8DDQ3_9NOST|nr:hypothetical protein [Anabaena azotica]MBD2504769.1 hypothetical protein [Anabaena azotica FACHB-119]